DVGVEPVNRDHAEQSGTETDGEVCPQSRGLAGRLPLEADQPTEGSGQHQPAGDLAHADDGLHRRQDEAGPHHRRTIFFRGAHASSNRFSPTLGKRTIASALSPAPSISSTTPSPHLPWTTSSPTATS